MLLLAARQEVTKKRAQAFPLGTPAALPQGIRRGVAASGFLYRKSFLLSRRAGACSRRLCGVLLLLWVARFFAFFFYVRSYCATLSRADRFACFYDTSCYAARSVQETRQGGPPWISRGLAAGHPTAGCAVGLFVQARVGQRIFAIPFCSKFVLNRGRSRGQKFLSSLVACYFRVGDFLSNRQRKS